MRRSFVNNNIRKFSSGGGSRIEELRTRLKEEDANIEDFAKVYLIYNSNYVSYSSLNNKIIFILYFIYLS